MVNRGVDNTPRFSTIRKISEAGVWKKGDLRGA